MRLYSRTAAPPIAFLCVSTSRETDLKLLAQTVRDLGEGRHGRISVAVFQTAKVCGFHSASVCQLLLGKAGSDVRPHNALRHFTFCFLPIIIYDN